jgi:hypothetical protein
MSYNINAIVDYADNISYRKCIRDAFQMSSANYHCPEEAIDANDIDKETLDEYFYDEPQFKTILNEIYKKTIDEVDFEEIYETAAHFMISNDCDVGLTVLFAYDYFRWFHPVLVNYLTGKPYKNEYRQLEFRLNCDERKHKS